MSSMPVPRNRYRTITSGPRQPASSEGTNFVAIKQHGVRIAGEYSLINAELIKIVRVTTRPALQHYHDGAQRTTQPPPRNTEAIADRTASLKLVHPEALPKTKQRFAGRRVALRSVGEMVADETGKLYEVRGRQLHRLGDLVTDQMGRTFEICPAGNGHDNKMDARHTNASSAGPADVTPDTNILATSESSEGQKSANEPRRRSIMARLVHWLLNSLNGGNRHNAQNHE